MTAPRWLVRLLEWAAPADLADDVVGDLEEVHRRRVRDSKRFAELRTVAEGLGQALFYGSSRTWAALRNPSWISGPELRLALRLVRSQPIVTLTSVVALGFGIGIAAGGFSVFNQALGGELPFDNGDRFVRITSRLESTGARANLELQRFRAIRESVPAFEYVGATVGDDLNIRRSDDTIERVVGARVTPGSFAHLPYAPIAGRLFAPGDGRLGTPRVALIRESLWVRTFNRSLEALGQTINVAGDAHTIVGVLPDGAGYPNDPEIWLALDESRLGAFADPDAIQGRLVGILTEEANPEQALQQLTRVSDAVALASGSGLPQLRFDVRPLADLQQSPQVQLLMVAFMSVLVAVLLVIAANVANLFVARTSRRSAELAVRTALGASRARLVTQLFTEVLMVSALASVLGLGIAGVVLKVYDGVLDELPFWVDLRLDPSTVITVLALALLASVVMGLLPALRATGRDPATLLRAGSAGAGLAIGRVGGAMIALEVGLSVALLGIAVVFAQGFAAYVNPAFSIPDDRVLTAQVVADAPLAGPVGDSATSLASALTLRLRQLPGVTAASVASHLPRTSPWPEPIQLEGIEEVALTPTVFTDAAFFEVLDVQPRVGRFFDAIDGGPQGTPVAIINEAFALDHFGTTQAVGRRLRIADDRDDETVPVWHEIIGVAPNVIEVAGAERGGGVYLPFTTRRIFSVALKATTDPMDLAGPLRQTLFELDPGLDVSRVVPLADVGAENRAALMGMSSALTGIGIIALLLSLAGVYSIVSLSVTQRTREIGVRVALGARPGSILWAVLRRSGGLVVGGAIVGSLLGWRLANVEDAFTFSLPDVPSWLFPTLILLVTVAGGLACWVPVRRALRIQPVEALQSEA